MIKPVRHRRIFRATAGKDPIKHSSATIGNTGAGAGSFFQHEIFKTSAGVRPTTGGVIGIKDIANTESQCMVGDVIKYVNICLECAPRGADPTNDNDNAGWLEWAVVWSEEITPTPGVANIGVATLGVIASHNYRQNCLLTGCFPIGTKQAMAQDLKIKLPKKCVKLRMGAILQIFCYIRTSSSTDVRTDSHRLMASSHFKVYS